MLHCPLVSAVSYLDIVTGVHTDVRVNLSDLHCHAHGLQVTELIFLQ
jgi:hypothetical protein